MRAIFIIFTCPLDDEKLRELITYFGKRNILSSSNTHIALNMYELNEDDLSKINKVTSTETIIINTDINKLVTTEYNCSRILSID